MSGTVQRPPGRPAGALRSRRIALALALGWIGLLVILALFADVLPLPGPERPVGRAGTPPFTAAGPWLGTDGIGRDLASRLVYGVRISMMVSIGATAIAVVIGVVMGLLSAYLKGPIEAAINILTDVVLSFPPLLLLLALSTVVRPGVSTLVISLGLLFVPPFARLARATAMAQLNRDYITAARALGASHARILFRELLPNCIQPVISYSVVVIALIVVIEGSLSFLGVGVPPPAPSWGGMIADGKERLDTAAYMVIVPSIMIFLTVFAFNTVGDMLRRRASQGGGEA